MIISIDEEKAFNKIQHPFMIKKKQKKKTTSPESGHQESIPNIIKVVYDKNPEKAMAPHSSTLAWRIPWMEEPGGL